MRQVYASTHCFVGSWIVLGRQAHICMRCVCCQLFQVTFCFAVSSVLLKSVHSEPCVCVCVYMCTCACVCVLTYHKCILCSQDIVMQLVSMGFLPIVVDIIVHITMAGLLQGGEVRMGVMIRMVCFTPSRGHCSYDPDSGRGRGRAVVWSQGFLPLWRTLFLHHHHGWLVSCKVEK